MKKKIKRYGHYFFGLLLLFSLLLIVLSANQKNLIVTSNINRSKSMGTNQFKDNYLVVQELTQEKPAILYASFEEAMAHVQEERVAFTGKLTAYGPDCVGCGGNSACQPKQNFTNGNIYFNDATYGQVRIVAADKSLPCGSMIRISNINIYQEPILAVVMDRGGSIKGNHLDLLFTSEKNLEGFSTQKNIQFEILRYGW